MIKQLLFLFALCLLIPWTNAPAQLPLSPNGSYTVSAAPIDFRLISAQANINKKDYILSSDMSPTIYPLGDNFYRLEFEMARNSRSSLRGNESIQIHFFYDGLRLTFFGDRNGNERPDRHEQRKEHLIRHKQELITEGNRSFMRSADLFIELGRHHVSTPSNVRSLKLHFIFI